MKKFVTAALLAAIAMPVALPATAYAQSHRERQDVRQERHDVQRTRQNGNRQQARPASRDTAEGYSELRDRNHRWGNNDWQGWRNGNRGTFARGNWRAPFRYQNFRPGLRIGFDLFGARYRISDPWRYHLPAPGYNQVWVRHYDDLLLVDTRRGVVVRVIRNFYW